MCGCPAARCSATPPHRPAAPPPCCPAAQLPSCPAAPPPCATSCPSVTVARLRLLMCHLGRAQRVCNNSSCQLFFHQWCRSESHAVMRGLCSQALRRWLQVRTVRTTVPTLVVWKHPTVPELPPTCSQSTGHASKCAHMAKAGNIPPCQTRRVMTSLDLM